MPVERNFQFRYDIKYWIPGIKKRIPISYYLLPILDSLNFRAFRNSIIIGYTETLALHGIFDWPVFRHTENTAVLIAPAKRSDGLSRRSYGRRDRSTASSAFSNYIARRLVQKDNRWLSGGGGQLANFRTREKHQNKRAGTFERRRRAGSRGSRVNPDFACDPAPRTI